MREIYLDNAAATPVDRRVQATMIRVMRLYGNPSSYNNSGRVASEELVRSRLRVARFLGAHAEEVVFTASGSEANSLAIQGVFGGGAVGEASEVITTAVEHPSVLNNVSSLGPDVVARYAQVDSQGRVLAGDVMKLVTAKTRLVSVMYANNEIGTIMPVAQIGRGIAEFRKKNGTEFPLFHVDACQAAGYLPMNVRRLGADLLTFNGSKLYGPHGIGVLYVRRGVDLIPIIRGGSQEYGARAGTENLPAIAGMAEATRHIDFKEAERLSGLRDLFFREIKKLMPNIRINGALGKERLANNINISVPGLESENLLLELDKYGVRAGSGSACTAHSVEPSHVLSAIGTKSPYLGGVLRFSLGRATTKKDIIFLLTALPEIERRLIRRLR